MSNSNSHSPDARLRSWLASVGLEQYAEAFARNDVDFEALRLLTELDFEKLGVSLGHRRKLLKIIAELNAGATAAAASETASDKQSPAQPVSSPQAERRQLTVLFCDLVSSTELSTRLDPEEYRELVRAYQAVCGEEIARFEGHVAQYLGDGLLVYFGYPKAHEDDAQRAVRAGLGIVDAVAGLKVPTASLAVRVGIHTGVVVVGEVGSGATQEQLALGDTPNLAARLQSLASPGAVVLSHRSRQLAGGSFDYRDLGSHSLKGIGDPVRAWQAIRDSHAESRFEAATRGAVAPMVGRELEFSVVLHAWQQAKSGRGQVVMLCGEPGIGKSRVLRALREKLSEEDISPWQYQCSPYFVNSALYPIIQNLERTLRFDRDDSPKIRLDKLERFLDIYARPKVDANLIGRALNLPAEQRYGALSMTLQKQKEQTLRALNDIIEAAARSQPVLMLFEDVHWADPTTLEALEALLQRLDRIPVQLVMTYRPEFRPQWVGQPAVTALTLSRLGPEQIQVVATRVAAGKALPDEITRQIVTKTDGIPLFVEELTKAILESGLLTDQGDRYELSGPLPALAIPSTLRDSLMARLDRFAPVKEVAQIGACIGREFPHQLMSLVSPLPGDQLQRALDALVDSELVFKRGQPPSLAYLFKHALIQEAAYDSLLKSKRAQIHSQIATALEEHFWEIAATQPELIAHHYTESGRLEDAIPHLHRAGELALSRLALPESIAHLDRGLDLIERLPPSVRRDQLELDLRTSAAVAWMTFRGWAAPENKRHADAAWALAQSLGGKDHALRILWVLYVYDLNVGHVRESLKWAEELIRLAEPARSEAMYLTGHMAATMTRFFLGEFKAVERHADLIEEKYDLARHRSVADLTTFDPRSVGLDYLARAQLQLGFPERAVRTVEEAVKHARQRGHPADTCYALFFAAIVRAIRGDIETRAAIIDELERLAREHRLSFYVDVIVPLQRAWLALLPGRASQDAETGVRQAIDQWRRAGQAIGLPGMYAGHAKSAALLGKLDFAMALLDDALRQIATPGWEERESEAEVLRMKGWVLSLKRDLANAEQNYRASLEVAREQEAKGSELHTATTYARFLKDQRRGAEALAVLKPVYEWFTEGFDTNHLKEAKALLEELSAR